MKPHNVVTRNAILSKEEQNRAVFATAWKTDVLITRKGWVVKGQCFIAPLDDALEPVGANRFTFIAHLGWMPPVVRRTFKKSLKTENISIQWPSITPKSQARHDKLEQMVPNWMGVLYSKIRFYCMQI